MNIKTQTWTVKICLIGFLIILTSYKTIAQTDNKKILVITIYECAKFPDYNKIVVTEKDKKIEEVQLAVFDSKNFDVNLIEITKVLNKYKSEDYKLTSTLRGNITPNSLNTVLVSTYVFEK